MHRKKDKKGKSRSLMVLVLTLLLVFSMGFVAATFFQLIRNAKFEQEWISMATEVQVSSQQLAKSAIEAGGGNMEAFNELSSTYRRMTAAMASLRNGSSDSGLPPVPADVADQMAQLGVTWDRMSVDASSIRDSENLLLSLGDASSKFSAIIPAIQETSDKVVRQLTESGAPNQQVFAASRQLVLADRMLRHVTEVLRGGSSAVGAASKLSDEIELFNRFLTALRHGNQKLGITQVRNQQALASLGQVNSQFGQARLQRVQGCLGAIVQSELEQDVADVRAHRRFADVQRFADPVVTQSLSQQSQHVPLAPGQSVAGRAG